MANAKPVDMNPKENSPAPMSKDVKKVKTSNELRDNDGKRIRGSFEMPNGTVITQH